MPFFASVTFLLRNIIVTSFVEKISCIKIDTKSFENKCVSSVIRIMHDTHCIKKIPLRNFLKGILHYYLHYYLRFCLPALRPPVLF